MVATQIFDQKVDNTEFDHRDANSHFYSLSASPANLAARTLLISEH
ncbi:hypothetical protein S1OALGB6SA_490 [Olavius algarvensis spirochete endosymbiont]|nr:hypothetical protein S1OALGB6SA_490 [Olavius algarvensis spirochete endosymbiont]